MKSLVYSTIKDIVPEMKPRKLVDHLVSNFNKYKEYLVFKAESKSLSSDIKELKNYFSNNLDPEEGEELWQVYLRLLDEIPNGISKYYDTNTGYIILVFYTKNDKLTSIDNVEYLGTQTIGGNETIVEPSEKTKVGPGVWVNIVREYIGREGKISSRGLKVKLSPDLSVYDMKTGERIGVNQVFSNIKSRCKTRCQRIAFNKLIKSFSSYKLATEVKDFIKENSNLIKLGKITNLYDVPSGVYAKVAIDCEIPGLETIVEKHLDKVKFDKSAKWYEENEAREEALSNFIRFNFDEFAYALGNKYGKIFIKYIPADDDFVGGIRVTIS